MTHAQERPAASPPVISVVIPCFNDERHVGEAIDSVLADGGDSVEVVVVDDGSEDGSVGAVRLRQNRVRLVRHEKNLGVAAAINTGAASSQAPLVAILASDDRILSGWCQAMLAAASARSDAAVYLPAVDVIDLETGRQIHEMVFRAPLDLHRVLSYELPATCGTVFRREILVAHPYRPIVDRGWEARSSEDWQFWLEWAVAGLEAVSVPGARAQYRARVNSVSKDPYKKWRSGLVLLEDRNLRHVECVQCEAAARAGRRGLRGYCFGLDLAGVFDSSATRRVRLARTAAVLRRDPVLAPRLAYAFGWRFRDRVLRRRAHRPAR